MNPHLEGLLLVVLAVLLEAIVDLLMDHWKIARRETKGKRTHH